MRITLRFLFAFILWIVSTPTRFLMVLYAYVRGIYGGIYGGIKYTEELSEWLGFYREVELRVLDRTLKWIRTGRL